MKRIKLEVHGMRGVESITAVREVLASIPGAQVQEATLGALWVAVDPAQVSPAALAIALTQAGYPSTAVGWLE